MSVFIDDIVCGTDVGVRNSGRRSAEIDRYDRGNKSAPHALKKANEAKELDFGKGESIYSFLSSKTRTDPFVRWAWMYTHAQSSE